MIQVHNELNVDLGDDGDSLSFWLVTYGPPPCPAALQKADAFIHALALWCLSEGWELECGDDPYQEKSLRIFDGGFSSPDEKPDWSSDEIGPS